MPLPIAAIAGISLGAKALASLFGRRAQTSQVRENNRAQTAALTLAQKQREDQRRARLAFGQGLLGRVPANVDGSGGSLALDPALYARLDEERKYNFAPTAAASTGGGSAFLEGLFGGAADVAPYLLGGQSAGSAPAPSAHGSPAQGIPAVDLDELRALGRTRPTRV
jgi:hypothetical protein